MFLEFSAYFSHFWKRDEQNSAYYRQFWYVEFMKSLKSTMAEKDFIFKKVFEVFKSLWVTYEICNENL